MIKGIDLNNITIIVGSVTYAIKLRKLLTRGGIRSKLVKLDDSKNNNGCVYGVEINKADFLGSVVIMNENQIEYSVYNRDDL